MHALDQYLCLRGIEALDAIDAIDAIRADCPLVASTLDAQQGVSYSALYRAVGAWLKKDLQASDLSVAEKLDARKPRCICCATPAARGRSSGTCRWRPCGANSGMRTPKITMRYAKPQLERLQAEMEKGFG